MIFDKLDKIVGWLKLNWRKCALYAAGFLVVVLMIFQIGYPSNKILPFTRVDGIGIGGQDKQIAASKLDEAYNQKDVELYLNQQEEALLKAKITETGLKASNIQRLNSANHPWYLKVIPTSLFWGTLVVDIPSVDFIADREKAQKFVERHFTADCQIQPKNPTTKVANNKLEVVAGKDGGDCEANKVITELSNLKTNLKDAAKVRLTAKPIPPKVSTEDLQRLVERIEQRLSAGVNLMVGEEKIEIDPMSIRQWLEFNVDSETPQATLNVDQAGGSLQKLLGDKLHKPAGVTRVKTMDFAEISRQEGVKGQELDKEKTIAGIVGYLVGESDVAVAVTREINPRIEYTRSYSPTNTGLSALIQNYTVDKPGVYGISLIELSGERRRAEFNETKAFETASTYKVYVAYSVLKRIEAGQMAWGDYMFPGKDVAKCFDDMIVRSDNPCAEEFVKKIGYTPLHRDAIDLGMKGTSFIDKESFKTTAKDLSQFMAMLETSQLPISKDNRSRFIEALKRNIYRQGVPAGASGTTANKVGFIKGLLHDTAIVYSPKGTYVLTVLTDGSSWANIADLTRQIESLRG